MLRQAVSGTVIAFWGSDSMSNLSPGAVRAALPSVVSKGGTTLKRLLLAGVLAVSSLHAQSGTFYIGTYARDEAEWLAHPADMRALGDEAQSLATRIDVLNARVESLAVRVAAVTGRPGDS